MLDDESYFEQNRMPFSCSKTIQIHSKALPLPANGFRICPMANDLPVYFPTESIQKFSLQEKWVSILFCPSNPNKFIHQNFCVLQVQKLSLPEMIQHFWYCWGCGYVVSEFIMFQTFKHLFTSFHCSFINGVCIFHGFVNLQLLQIPYLHHLYWLPSRWSRDCNNHVVTKMNL